MAKIGLEIVDDIIGLLRGSTLAGMLTGEVYHGYGDGTSDRPRDSVKEDVVVIFTTGLSEQIQTGVVTLNIFVPDFAPNADGVLHADGRRLKEIGREAQRWVEGLRGSEYRFELSQTITSMAEPSLKQHFVSVKIRYRLYEDGD